MPALAIDASAIRRPVKANALGLNVNFLADHAEQRRRGKGYLAALRHMGARSLRYPGGEKSNEYLWSVPPWKQPLPTLGLTGSQARLFVEGGQVTEDGRFLVDPMDFDEFMGLCRRVKAQPMICVNLGSAYVKEVPGKLNGTSRERLLQNAVEWVRYANVIKGYGVRDWEIGNESYWRGSVATLKAADYAADVAEFSRAMKAVDPSIRIGANGHVEKDYVSTAEEGNGPIWWKTLLERASSDIDFLVVHPYPCFEWGSYDYFAQHSPMMTDAVEQASAALAAWAPKADAARIRIQATETNAFDWAASKWYQGNKGGWAWGNDLGHALVLFELLGQHLVHSKVDGVQVWNTRWFSTPSHLEDVLDEDNRLLATGQAMGLWGRHLKSCLQSLPGLDCGPLYASLDRGSMELSVFLMNKQRNAFDLNLKLGSYPNEWTAAGTVLTGRGPEDQHPSLKPCGRWKSSHGSVSLVLPPVSITVLKFRPTH